MTRAATSPGKRARALAALAPWALAALLLAPRGEASVTREDLGRESHAASLAGSEQPVTLIAPVEVETLTLFVGDELGRAVGQGDRATRFALGLAPDELAVDGLVLASRVRELGFHPLQGLDLVDAEPLRGPPECEPKTRIGGLELSEPFLQRERGGLSLGLQWACDASRCGLVEGKPLDPLGLFTPTPDTAWDLVSLAVDTGFAVYDYVRDGRVSPETMTALTVDSLALATPMMPGGGAAAMVTARVGRAVRGGMRAERIGRLGMKGAQVAGKMPWLASHASQVGHSESQPSEGSNSSGETGAAGSEPPQMASSHSGPEPSLTPSDLKRYRRATPNRVLQRMVNPEGPKVDAAYGTAEIKLEAGHLVSADSIMRDSRFPRLSDAGRREILNLPENIVPMARRPNASQGKKSISEWQGHSELGPLPPERREVLLQQEEEAARAIEAAFQRLLPK